ncbi:MAG: type II secretion system protein GspD [Sedimentisphaerales bacterium]|nr:type II secretion system protein GspD [Sedimentisphaerales bacterium]
MYYDSNVKEKKRNKRSILTICFVLTMMWTISVVASDQATIGEGEKIPTFNCEEDFGIRKALALLGSLCGKNIVPSPNVDGQLAFRSLKDVTFEEAMDAILGDGFVYAEEGNLIKVYTKVEYENIMKDPKRRVHKVISLYYITAEEASKLITPVISDAAVIQSSSDAEKGISGGSGGSGGGGGSLGSGGGGNSMALNDMIVIYDFPENIEKAEEVIKSIDVKPLQVLIEATILSAALNEDMYLGIDWNLLSGYAVDGFPSAIISSVGSSQIGTPLESTGFASIGDGLRVGISGSKLQGFISALEEITDVTVMANPKIMAVNKQQGSLLIGKKLGYLSSQTVTDGGTSTSQVDFYESGTRLVFRPYIGNDGYIRMEIYPKDSSAELNATTQAPDETTTELQTNILVKDGETVVIGGLFREVVNTVRQQIPILGNIPFVGWLFSGQTDLTQREEVIVMLTPHIIEDPVESIEGIENVSRKMRSANDELIPISRRNMAEDYYTLAAQLYLEGDTYGALKNLDIAIYLRPTYIAAIDLKEKILKETNPDEYEKLDRNVLNVVEN